MSHLNKPSIETPSNSFYKTVTESRPWRHTVGRVSCLLRIPVYALFSGLQTLKIGVKFAVSVLTLGQLYRWEKTRAWSFKGVARDGIMLMTMIQRSVNSLWCCVWAPPKNYFSFPEACEKSIKYVFVGHYHADTEKKEKTVSDLWKTFKLSIPAYHKQIIQCDCIASSYFKSTLSDDGRTSPKLTLYQANRLSNCYRAG